MLANAGSLVEPLNRTEYRNGSKKRPDQLFSHSDQQQQGQTSTPQQSFLVGPDGLGRTDRGSRHLDEFANGDADGDVVFRRATFLTGRSVRGLALPTAGNFGFSGDPDSEPERAPVSALGRTFPTRSSPRIRTTWSRPLRLAWRPRWMQAEDQPIINGTLPPSIRRRSTVSTPGWQTSCARSHA